MNGLPKNISSDFGWIEVDGKVYDYDIVIYPNGNIERRKKEISKRKHGTSHKLDLEEITGYLGHEEEVVVIGTGQYGALSLTEESERLLRDLGLEIIQLPTKEAIKRYLELCRNKRVLGIFHVTC